MSHAVMSTYLVPAAVTIVVFYAIDSITRVSSLHCTNSFGDTFFRHLVIYFP